MADVVTDVGVSRRPQTSKTSVAPRRRAHFDMFVFLLFFCTRSHLGLISGPSWGLLAPSWRHLGASWRLLGPPWGHLGAVLRPRGAILEPPGAIWEPFWAILGSLGAIRGSLESFSGHLGISLWVYLRALLEPFQRHHGTSSHHFGVS